MASANSIKRFTNDTYPEKVTILDGNIPVNLAGASILMKIKYSTPEQITGSITDAANGIVEFPFTTVSNDNEGIFDYEIEVTYSSGYIATHDRGTILFQDDIQVS